MRWLALDVGSRRVGVAACDGEERVVTPLAPLPFGSADELARRVAALIAERGIEGVVVGVPVTLAGRSRGEGRVRGVLDALRALAIPVETCDERGTTAEASARLASAGVPRRRWEGVVDGVAASIILETFLASRNR